MIGDGRGMENGLENCGNDNKDIVVICSMKCTKMHAKWALNDVRSTKAFLGRSSGQKRGVGVGVQNRGHKTPR